jgi:hypothetical protein
MTRAFPTASSPAIIKAQEVVTGTSTLLSKGQSAKEKQKCSTTNRPSQRSVIMFMSPPITWPSALAMDHANMYLGSHKHSLCFVSEEQNHLGGLALFCNDLPSLEENTIHTIFQTTMDQCKDSDVKSVVCVEVGSSKSSLHITDFPYFSPKLNYDDNGFLVPITPLKVQ